MQDLVATYRLQFRNGMDFARAAALVPYLQQIGVSHLYASPIFAAVSGSTHGYDVTDHGQLDPDLGGSEGFGQLCAALKTAGLGLILDIVPNHMAASPENPWWRDVLEWGQAGPHVNTFDIDWSAPRLILPVLGASYGDVLDAGELGLDFDPANLRFSLSYFALRVPLTPPTYADLLTACGGRLEELAAEFAGSTPATVDAARARLGAVLDEDTPSDLDAQLSRLAADHEFLHELHEQQPWRLASWRLGRDGLTNRRFFEIIDLVGVRVENPSVFAAVHRLPLQLVADGKVDGLRVDHVDGLADPTGYLRRLADAAAGNTRIYVEKILEGDEQLRRAWPVAGTTGYEFITAVAGLLTDPAGEAAFDAAFAAFIGEDGPAVDPVAIKQQILQDNLASELGELVRLAAALFEDDPQARDFGEGTIRQALVALMAVFPVYRTYVNAFPAAPEDRSIIADVVAKAKETTLLEDPSAIDAIAASMVGDAAPENPQALHFTVRFQQTSGPVMAKSIEDTLFYRSNRLIGLNEVGGDPDRFGAPITAFHEEMATRADRQPEGLSATATHDTKRGEDARARLYALSEQPELWVGVVRDLADRMAPHRIELDDGIAPEPSVEWMIYQAILAGWPPALSSENTDALAEYQRRADEFVQKALREAKARTSWTAPNAAYETTVLGFVRHLLDPTGDAFARFTDEAAPFLVAGALNSLVQTLLKIAAPGVPDIYQGTETWDFSFVDPDNRRPVDFAGLHETAADVLEEPLDRLLANWRDGRIKRYVVATSLSARAREPELFTRGTYRPLPVVGPWADRIIAFGRTAGDRHAIAVVPVRTGGAIIAGVPIVEPGFWSNTALTLPPDLADLSFKEVFTGRIASLPARLDIAAALSDFPIALYLAEGP